MRNEHDRQFWADEEPPIDTLQDTTPSHLVKGGQWTRYVILGGLIGSLILTITVTVFVFTASGDEKNEKEPVEVNVGSSTQVVDIGTVSLPTVTLEPSPVPQTATPLPTAAVDEVAVALSQPPLRVPEEVGIGRQLDPYTISGLASRDSVISYTVIAGDTMTKIAGRFGLSMCTLVWSNPRHLISPLYPGAVLNILPVDGVFYKIEKTMSIQSIADETGVNPYDIIDSPYNEVISGLLPETMLPVGMKLIVPGGNGGSCNIWTPPVAVVSSTGTTSSRGGRALRSCNVSVDNPGFPTNNPLGGARYTFYQAFTSAHSGVDLAARTGTPVYASGSGTVIYAGWNDGGYGNAIIIDHGTSYSLYAHLSEIYVECGQAVNSMQQIGEVGSTGNSSGPHLHFEIRDAGFVPVNPVYNVNGGL
ncbi:MAG: M23 family metallopeptidase [Anaerolineae bacterium]|nr:M23 family metallopeptidase [Anaerolineae bacterium]